VLVQVTKCLLALTPEEVAELVKLDERVWARAIHRGRAWRRACDHARRTGGAEAPIGVRPRQGERS